MGGLNGTIALRIGTGGSVAITVQFHGGYCALSYDGWESYGAAEGAGNGEPVALVGNGPVSLQCGKWSRAVKERRRGAYRMKWEATGQAVIYTVPFDN